MATARPGHRRFYPNIPIAWTELREVSHSEELSFNVNENDIGDTPMVEIWVDHPVGDARPALANLRLLPEDAVRLAEMLLCAAERIES